MRVLVIGGTAFMGPHAVRSLVADGHEVTVFHRGQTEADLPDGVTHITGDRENLPGFRDQFAALRLDVTLHMVVVTAQDAWNAVQTLRGICPRLVMASSADVYRAYDVLRGRAPLPADPAPLTEASQLRTTLYPYRDRFGPTEDTPFPPMAEYDKIPAERLVMGDPDLAGTVVRLPAVYGPHDRQHRLFGYLKRMDDGRRGIVLEAEGAGWRMCRGYVANMGHALALATTRAAAAGLLFNAADLAQPTEREWIRAIAQAAGWDGEIREVPRAALPEALQQEYQYEQDWALDSSAIRSALGYADGVALAEAVRETVEWQRAHPPEDLTPYELDKYELEDEVLAR